MTQQAAEAPAVKRVMGIFAHPDDPEFFCGGTFARWAAEGAEIIFVLATSGDKGSSDPEMTGEKLVAIREAEERNAAAALGVKDVIFLRYPDGELTPSLALRGDIVRQTRPYSGLATVRSITRTTAPSVKRCATRFTQRRVTASTSRSTSAKKGWNRTRSSSCSLAALTART